MSLAVDN